MIKGTRRARRAKRKKKRQAAQEPKVQCQVLSPSIIECFISLSSSLVQLPLGQHHLLLERLQLDQQHLASCSPSAISSSSCLLLLCGNIFIADIRCNFRDHRVYLVNSLTDFLLPLIKGFLRKKLFINLAELCAHLLDQAQRKIRWIRSTSQTPPVSASTRFETLVTLFKSRASPHFNFNYRCIPLLYFLSRCTFSLFISLTRCRDEVA